jgi:hypothetical protein
MVWLEKRSRFEAFSMRQRMTYSHGVTPLCCLKIRITFLAGFDVQHTLQEKTPAEVRQEVRFLIDTFDRADGGMGLAAGNGIVAGTPLENIRAFLDEALIYGQAHRRNMNAMAG